jgi:hypothetical protein
MEVTFDTEITIDDLQVVNNLRYWMNIFMRTDEDQLTPDNGPRDARIKSESFCLHKYSHSCTWSLSLL